MKKSDTKNIMGEKIIIQSIKNCSAVVAILTFFGGLWYTVLDLPMLILGGVLDVVWRLWGVGIIVLLACVPYILFIQIFKKMHQRAIGVGAFFVFFTSDIVSRSFASFVPAYREMNIIFCIIIPFIILFCMCIIYYSDVFLHISQRFFMKINYVVFKKQIATFFRRRIL